MVEASVSELVVGAPSMKHCPINCRLWAFGFRLAALPLYLDLCSLIRALLDLQYSRTYT